MLATGLNRQAPGRLPGTSRGSKANGCAGGAGVLRPKEQIYGLQTTQAKGGHVSSLLQLSVILSANWGRYSNLAAHISLSQLIYGNHRFGVGFFSAPAQTC